MLISPAVHQRLCAARKLLASPELPALSVPELATRVGLSPFHLTRRFAAVFGATPHQYRLATRLERAQRLLARGELSVTEVCWELGFSSLGSFSTLFSARVGESPRAYQRRMRRVCSSPGLTSLLAPSCLGLMACLPPGAWRSFREAQVASST